MPRCTRSVSRPTDLPARFGGEEFVVLLAGVTDRVAAHVGERLRANVEELKIPHVASTVSAAT